MDWEQISWNHLLSFFAFNSEENSLLSFFSYDAAAVLSQMKSVRWRLQFANIATAIWLEKMFNKAQPEGWSWPSRLNGSCVNELQYRWRRGRLCHQQTGGWTLMHTVHISEKWGAVCTVCTGCIHSPRNRFYVSWGLQWLNGIMVYELQVYVPELDSISLVYPNGNQSKRLVKLSATKSIMTSCRGDSGASCCQKLGALYTVERLQNAKTVLQNQLAIWRTQINKELNDWIATY